MSESIFDLLQPVDQPVFSNAEGSARIADRIEIHRFDHKPSIEGCRVAIFGVNDGRNSGDNEGCSAAPDSIRDWFYRLTPPTRWAPTVDLGDIRAGLDSLDTEKAVSDLISELIQMGVIPIVLGGGQDLTFSIYSALESVGRPMNVVTIDSRLDFGGDPELHTSRNFMNRIVLHEPNFLFDYVNIGHQGYLTDPDTLELLERLQFEAIRLGTAHNNPKLVEPTLRDADLVSFDLSSIRASDHPASTHAGPNGFSSSQFCQLARYAGLSDKMMALGIFEHNPDLDDRGRGSHLAAQVLWHMIDGIFSQTGDYPKCNAEEYTKYLVDLQGQDHEVAFYKSSRSDRWWMDVPIPTSKKNNKDHHHLVPCSYEDYEEASEGELPDRWWRTYQKLA
jgi:arginase family enzyme